MPGSEGLTPDLQQDLRTKWSRNEVGWEYGLPAHPLARTAPSRQQPYDLQVSLFPRSDPSELAGEDTCSLFAMKGRLGRLLLSGQPSCSCPKA